MLSGAPVADFSAREPHFVDHLAPMWSALPSELRGTFYVGADALTHARRLGIPAVVGDPRRFVPGPIVVAAWSDLRVASRCRRPVVLAEHGAGQTYGNRHTSYAGGTGREAVRLFLVPGEQPAARNLKRYPNVPNVLIGSPRVDELARVPKIDGPPTVAISFHWRCMVAPETMTALDHYAPGLAAARAVLAAAGVVLLGHAHPRIMDEASAVYDAAGIETVPDFADVVARADVYAVDNSSTLFEFAALGRPVLVLNAPHFRREKSYGLRFWSESTVGAHVNHPAELAGAFLDALDENEDRARVRAETIARVYAVTDGSSAQRAALAIGDLVSGRYPGSCPVCGKAHATCDGSTAGPAQEVRSKTMRKTKLRYPNPDRPGAFLNLTADHAARLGVTAQPVADPAPSTKEAPMPEPETEPETPRGALPRGGPTARARREDEPEDKRDEKPKDKARPSPSRRRRITPARS